MIVTFRAVARPSSPPPPTRIATAYHAAEGNVMDAQGFADLFTSEGVIN